LVGRGHHSCCHEIAPHARHPSQCALTEARHAGAALRSFIYIDQGPCSRHRYWSSSHAASRVTRAIGFVARVAINPRQTSNLAHLQQWASQQDPLLRIVAKVTRRLNSLYHCQMSAQLPRSNACYVTGDHRRSGRATSIRPRRSCDKTRCSSLERSSIRAGIRSLATIPAAGYACQDICARTESRIHSGTPLAVVPKRADRVRRLANRASSTSIESWRA
jgi:hypothetical protein